jgi:hypothetical protein
MIRLVERGARAGRADRASRRSHRRGLLGDGRVCRSSSTARASGGARHGTGRVRPRAAPDRSRLLRGRHRHRRDRHALERHGPPRRHAPAPPWWAGGSRGSKCDQATASATAGNRAAIALHGVSRDDVARRLVAPGRSRDRDRGCPREAPAAARASPAGRACAFTWARARRSPASFSTAESSSRDRDARAAQAQAPIVAVPGDRLCSAPIRRPSRSPGPPSSTRARPAARARTAGQEALETLEAGGLAERVALLSQAGFAGARRRRGASSGRGAGRGRAAASGVPSLLHTKAAGGSIARPGGRSSEDRGRGAPLRRGPPPAARNSERRVKSLLAREIEGAVFDKALEGSSPSGS